MQTHTDEYERVLAGSVEPIFKVDAWRDGQLVAAGLPLSGGQVTITGGQGIRSRVTLSVADPDGLFTPNPDSALAPFGSELHIRAGVMVGQTPELFSLGWFPVVSCQTTEKWRQVVRPAEPDTVYAVSRGAITTVEAVDRAQKVSDSRFLTRTQPTMGTVKDEIAVLLQGVVPWAGSTLPNASVPSTITYEDDRLAAAMSLADVLDAQLVFNAQGAATLLPNTPGSPVWTVGTKADRAGNLVSFNRRMSRDKMFNGVIVRSTDPVSGLTVQGIATETSGPLAWDGPMGRVPYFANLPVLTTSLQCDRAAETTLARLKRQRSLTLPISCTPNHALEVGDVVNVQAPKGLIPGEVLSITWPLSSAGLMSLSVAVDPFMLAEVS